MVDTQSVQRARQAVGRGNNERPISSLSDIQGVVQLRTSGEGEGWCYFGRFCVYGEVVAYDDALFIQQARVALKLILASPKIRNVLDLGLLLALMVIICHRVFSSFFIRAHSGDSPLILATFWAWFNSPIIRDYSRRIKRSLRLTLANAGRLLGRRSSRPAWGLKRTLWWLAGGSPRKLRRRRILAAFWRWRGVCVCTGRWTINEYVNTKY